MREPLAQRLAKPDAGTASCARSGSAGRLGGREKQLGVVAMIGMDMVGTLDMFATVGGVLEGPCSATNPHGCCSKTRPPKCLPGPERTTESLDKGNSSTTSLGQTIFLANHFYG